MDRNTALGLELAKKKNDGKRDAAAFRGDFARIALTPPRGAKGRRSGQHGRRGKALASLRRSADQSSGRRHWPALRSLQGMVKVGSPRSPFLYDSERTGDT